MATRRALWMHKLAEEVARGITERVQKGDVAQGASLGTREDIARENVTSTGVVERAIQMLEETGVVTETAEGQVVVAGYPHAEGFELPETAMAHLADVIAILELRLGVEVEAAALAAERSSKEDREEIRAVAEAYREAVEKGEGAARIDFRFHRAIAAASGNGYVLELLDYLGPLLIPRMRLRMPEKTGAPDESQMLSIREHGEILAAIEAGDAVAARRAMRAHLERTIQLVKTFESSGDAD